jgi:hypothetical protein
VVQDRTCVSGCSGTSCVIHYYCSINVYLKQSHVSIHHFLHPLPNPYLSTSSPTSTFTALGLNFSTPSGSTSSLRNLGTVTSLASMSAKCLFRSLSSSASTPRPQPSFSARASYTAIFAAHVAAVLLSMLCMLARTFWQALASGRSSAVTSSGERQLEVEVRSQSGVEAAWTASMSRGMVRAANMSPVPEKKSGSSGVSIRKRRGVKEVVAVEPMMVMSLISSSWSSGSCGGLGRDEFSASEWFGFAGLKREDSPFCVECDAGCVIAGLM